MDKELLAMRHIAKILSELEQDERERVLAWVTAKTFPTAQAATQTETKAVQ